MVGRPLLDPEREANLAINSYLARDDTGANVVALGAVEVAVIWEGTTRRISKR